MALAYSYSSCHLQTSNFKTFNPKLGTESFLSEKSL